MSDQIQLLRQNNVSEKKKMEQKLADEIPKQLQTGEQTDPGAK